MRSETRAVRPVLRAAALSMSSSGSDSALMWVMPCLSADSSSAAVLPTPEKMMRSGGTPAASALRNSPSETTSAPAPSAAKVRITARLPFALTA